MNKDEALEINLKTASLLEKDEPVIFAGSITLHALLFKKYYLEALDIAISKGAQIRVGCAEGLDLMVQKHCSERGYFNVFVYVPEDKRDEANIESEKFQTVLVKGKFKDRDRAMQKDCKRIVAVLSQYGGAASGTAASIISIYAKCEEFGLDCTEMDGYRVAMLLRRYMVPFDESLQKYVQDKESTK